MTRAYRVTPPGGGPAPPGPRPASMQPRAGVTVVAKRPPRVGKSAAELDGVTLPPPIRLGDALPQTAFNGAREQSHIQLETFSTETARLPQCSFCGRGEDVDVLVTAPGPAPAHRVCATCVETLVDTLRTELPKRRLRLAMERMLAGAVTPEMVDAVERMTGGKDG